MKRSLFTFIWLSFGLGTIAQADGIRSAHFGNVEIYKEMGLVFGVHQFHSTNFEFGVVNAKSVYSKCAFGSGLSAFSLSGEYNPFKNIGGISATFWTSAGTLFTLGLNTKTYTDFEKTSWGVKPFIGIGSGYWSLTWGYNFNFLHGELPGLHRGVFSLRYYLPLIQQYSK